MALICCQHIGQSHFFLFVSLHYPHPAFPSVWWLSLLTQLLVANLHTHNTFTPLLCVNQSLEVTTEWAYLKATSQLAESVNPKITFFSFNLLIFFPLFLVLSVYLILTPVSAPPSSSSSVPTVSYSLCRALRTFRSLFSPPPLLSPPISSPALRADLDAHGHNRWYSTTGCRSARIGCRSTFYFSELHRDVKCNRSGEWGQTRLWQALDPTFSGGIWSQGKLWCFFFSFLYSRPHLGMGKRKKKRPRTGFILSICLVNPNIWACSEECAE